ncbi:hypothetical protein WA026_021435 [Henosepilachna vigintioctopunctata]|uniref:Uncharacterized protein n=1 Tax=Henosepilachna vigintioctopunctata TaxID=420089 RepID=A0AAW1TXW7_9CUCU
MHKDAAIYIRNANKSYGDKVVLHNFCMTLPKGAIYGLLGASGCGKTTLLSCVVGRRLFNSGELWVLGGKPGTKGSGVPGPRVGYMPQEIALVGEFTVSDAMFYFGRLANMKDSRIRSHFQELKELLDLPPDDRYIKNCSGGQQRRVSFAVALIHKPELLILDEPTVGVDPVLRDRIWKYLIEITQKQNISVIITTHYIEETRQANLIGLMRGGKLLAEDSPDRLLRYFNTNNLEEVFLILSRQQETGNLNLPEVQDTSQFNSNCSIDTIYQETNASAEVLTSPKKKVKEEQISSLSVNRHRLKALMGKNWKQFYRNVSGWVFLLFFPVLEILAFLYAVGPDIKDIPIAVVNDENMNICGNFVLGESVMAYDSGSCHFHNLSCRFLTYLDNPMMKTTTVDSLPEALDGIRHGKYVGALYFAENYTSAAEERFNAGTDAGDDDLNFSQIKTYLDMSNRQIGYTVKYKLLDLYMKFQKSIFSDCDFLPKYADLPINFLKPVFGEEGEHFTEFMAPGILITLSFFSGTLLTSQIILTDRLEGIWDRSTVGGVTSIEITITHFILQFCVVIIQNFEIFLLAFWYYGLTSVGSFVILYFMVILQGIVGMACGFWISVVSNNHSMANIVATGTFYPMILLCGVLWPLEGQPEFLRIFSKCLPFTIPTQAFRNVFMKGWGIDHMEVINGVGIALVWFILLLSLSVYRLKNTQ